MYVMTSTLDHKEGVNDEFEKLMKDNQDKYDHEILEQVQLHRFKVLPLLQQIWEKPLVQDVDAADVSPKTSHLLAVKRIFRYLKGKPSLELWYAEATTDDNGEVQITTTIDGHLNTITEVSLRRHPKLDDHDGITSIPNSEIFEQLALLDITQIQINMQRKQLQQHSRTYHVPSLSIKVFNNVKRPTKGYSGQEVALFPTMLNVSKPSTSPSRITSLPSHSPEHSLEHSPDHTTATVSFPSPTQPTQPSPGA
ncbi:hypothetical protein Tco_0698780 [Tanacetum coccineum]